MTLPFKDRQGDAAAIRIPAKLLENVRIAIAVQMKRSDCRPDCRPDSRNEETINIQMEQASHQASHQLRSIPQGPQPTQSTPEQTTYEVIHNEDYVVEEPSSVDTVAKTT